MTYYFINIITDKSWKSVIINNIIIITIRAKLECNSSDEGWAQFTNFYSKLNPKLSDERLKSGSLNFKS